MFVIHTLVVRKRAVTILGYPGTADAKTKRNTPLLLSFCLYLVLAWLKRGTFENQELYQYL